MNGKVRNGRRYSFKIDGLLVDPREVAKMMGLSENDDRIYNPGNLARSARRVADVASIRSGREIEVVKHLANIDRVDYVAYSVAR